MVRGKPVLGMVAAVVALAAVPVFAGPRQGFGSHFRHMGVTQPAPVLGINNRIPDPWSTWGIRRPVTPHPPLVRPHHPSHGFGFSGFVPFGGNAAAAASAVNIVEVIDYGGYAPASYGPPVAAVAIAGPVAPPMPSLFEYDTGWYQLRGDGVTSPYVWVWIPKPPAAAPEAVPPSTSSERGPEVKRADQPRAPEPVRWTDDEGVTTWTNRLDRVPKRYRDQVQKPAE